MHSITGKEIMNPDFKNEQVRRCATCGQFVGTRAIRCPDCAGPIVSLGPLNWTIEDEAKAMEDLGIDTDSRNWLDEEEPEFQSIICKLWDKIETLEAAVDARDGEIEELENEITLHITAVKAGEKEIKELKARLADESLKGKVKKSLGVE